MFRSDALHETVGKSPVSACGSALSAPPPVRAARGHGPDACATGATRGFTIIEMMVVIGVIAIVLAIGIPAFNSMTIQQRESKTRQLLSGTLTRTHIVSVSDATLTAVRIFPAEWHLDPNSVLGDVAGRQLLTTYAYRHTYAANPDNVNNPNYVEFDERFERLEDGPTYLLPPDTWIAPSEAFDLTRSVSTPGVESGLLGDRVLTGRIGDFELNIEWNRAAANAFLDADDFLIVFDPETGVQPSIVRGDERPFWRLVAFDPRPAGSTPSAQRETDGWHCNGGRQRDQFRRHNFTGAVIYRREPFAALGVDASPAERRAVLQRLGKTFYVNPTGGSLVAGAGEYESQP